MLPMQLTVSKPKLLDVLSSSIFCEWKRMPTMSQCITRGHVAREQRNLSPLIFISFVQRMFQSSNLSLESSAKGLTTCRRFGTDLWRAPGSWERVGIHRCAVVVFLAPKRGSCYGLKHCRPMAGMAISSWSCKRRTRSAIRSQEIIEISTSLNVQWCFKYFRLFQGRLLFWRYQRFCRCKHPPSDMQAKGFCRLAGLLDRWKCALQMCWRITQGVGGTPHVVCWWLFQYQYYL